MGAQLIGVGTRVSYTPASDVDYGDVIVQGDLVGIATRDIKSGDTGRLALTGLFGIVKSTGANTAISAGAKVYWDDTSKVATTNSGGGANKLIGLAIRAATDSDRFVRVIMGAGAGGGGV